MNAKEIRVKKGLNQTQFWTPIGVTQSGGSRYEGSKKTPPREMSKPVKILVKLYHGSKRKIYRQRIDKIRWEL